MLEGEVIHTEVDLSFLESYNVVLGASDLFR